MSFRRLSKSLKYAFRGLLVAWHGIPFRIMVATSVVVMFLMFYFQVSRKEVVVLLLLIVFVLVLEIVNTIIEQLVDMLQPRLHGYVRTIKDMMAGAVLLASVFSFIVGVVIFSPYIFS